RIPVGDEPPEARLALFESIAREVGPAHGEQVPSLYQEVLINRHPRESLQAAGARFCALLSGCAQLGYPLLAAPLFEVVQDGFKSGQIPADRLDASIQDFLRQALVNPDLADALSRLESAATSGGIRVEGDHVVVGGVRVKTRRL
ncbi:MAG: hypothetical protein AB1758_08265, partial [Candidatus Eremiobacterota bacterium]